MHYGNIHQKFVFQPTVRLYLTSFVLLALDMCTYANMKNILEKKFKFLKSG